MEFIAHLFSLLASSSAASRLQILLAYAVIAPALAMLAVWSLRPPVLTRVGTRRIARAAVAAVLLLVLSVLATPTGFNLAHLYVKHWALQERFSKEDRQFDTRIASAIREHTKQQKQVPAPFVAQWAQSQRTAALPIAPLDEATLSRFKAEELQRIDAMNQSYGSRYSASVRHCEYRVWNPNGGAFETPLLAWVAYPSSPAQFGLGGQASYRGIARLRNGTSADVSFASWGASVESIHGSTDWLKELFFTPTAARIVVAPIAKDAEPHTHQSSMGTWVFVMPMIDSLSLAEYSSRVSAKVRVLPNDEGYELVLQTEAGELRKKMNYALGGSLRPEDLAAMHRGLRTALENPYDPSDDDGYPVEIGIGTDGIDAAQQIHTIVLQLKPREYLYWRSQYPDSTNLRTELLIRPLPSERRDSAGRLIEYETNYAAAPKLVGRFKCTDQPPGELRALRKHFN